ncbi:MAG: acetoacetate--CoA ligase [Candidatus Dormibacteria bacterium]
MAEDVRPMEEGIVLWEPPEALRRTSRMTAYRDWLESSRNLRVDTYQELWEWSTKELGAFWESIWDFFHVQAHAPFHEPLADHSMPGARWFEGSRLNYAEHALRAMDTEAECVVAISELGEDKRLSGSELRRQVGAVAAHLRESGIRVGDRVAAYVPNIGEALVGFLATASIGAIWSSCSPDFGEQAVLDRFQQIEPAVLLVVDGYRYGGREFDRREVVARLLRGLPTVRHVIEVPYLFPAQAPFVAGSSTWASVVAMEAELDFEAVPFDHPLWVVYSSGTTGLPKPIVHGHGGILLEHMKALALHADLGPGSRFFWFTTTGWMMWNYLVGGLLVGATIVLYDGSPAHPGSDRLWRLIEEFQITHFGTSAGHISASMKVGLRPRRQLDLSSLRFLGSTGSPLSPGGFEWVYREVKQDLWLSSLSGGTDLCTAFLLGTPWLPVQSGVIQCRGLGARVEAFNPAGQPVIEEMGELVITKPMPSMPIYFWGDQDGSRYRESYFATYPGVWRHGDWIKIRADGGAVIYGRSDSTINRHGVRMGTSEIYRAVEEMAEIRDCLVVDVPGDPRGSYMPMFVVLAPGVALDDALVARIKGRIRESVSPRHVPDVVMAVSEIPKTLSGKKLEIPVKRILQGVSPGDVVSLEAVQNPRALEPFVRLAAERHRRASAEATPGA